MELRELAACLRDGGLVCPKLLAQLAQLRALVELLWATRALSRAPLAQHEYTRTLLHLDLALVRLKMQVLLRQMEG